ncbi:MAG: hypothetical protein R6V85_16915 [Polyangia bacterium]
MTRKTVFAIVSVAALILAGACGQREEKSESVVSEGPKKAEPVEKVKRPKRPKLVGKPVGVLGAELFTAKVESVEGDVKLRQREDEPAAAAEKDALIYGGGWVETGAGGAARLTLRSIGRLSLGENSLLLVPEHGECGAVLVRGTAHLEGPKRLSSTSKCYLHTPATALQAQLNRVVLAASSNARTAIAALDEKLGITDLQGHTTELEPKKSFVVDPEKDEPLEVEMQLPEAESDDDAFAEWLAEEAGKKNRAGWMLEEASRESERLKLDVQRLEELMKLNRELSARRRELTHEGADEKEIAEASQRLTEQAGEMVDLQRKGILLIHSIHGLLRLASECDGGNDETEKRVAEIRDRIERLAEQLPPLFAKKRKTKVEFGNQRPNVRMR